MLEQDGGVGDQHPASSEQCAGTSYEVVVVGQESRLEAYYLDYTNPKLVLTIELEPTMKLVLTTSCCTDY